METDIRGYLYEPKYSKEDLKCTQEREAAAAAVQPAGKDYSGIINRTTNPKRERVIVPNHTTRRKTELLIRHYFGDFCASAMGKYIISNEILKW